MARIIDIAVFLPEKILSNQDLEKVFPSWTAQKIFDKTGIKERRIAADSETAGDMGIKAAENLFNQGNVDKDDIDFLIFCTQAPDYILPTTACIIQSQLNLQKTCGAIDINLGCSGYVYGLSIANGLIESGAASNVLLITSDTYSKYINPEDKSVRTLFGDAATATVVGTSIADECIGPFVFGTDGEGAENLIVPAGMFRLPKSSETGVEIEDLSGNRRAQDNLYMNGPEIMLFSLREVPKALNALFDKAKTSSKDYDYFVLHQANTFMLEALRKKLKLPSDKIPIFLEKTGNTVSSTIAIVLDNLFKEKKISESTKITLCGFGVGYSWSACHIQF